MKITSILSSVPEWFDPTSPGFQPPKSWKGTHVRFSIPVTNDPLREMAEARKLLEAKYPGAVLHLIPDHQKAAKAEGVGVDVKAGDDALMRSYLEKLVLPEHATVGQVMAYLKQFLPATGMFGVQGLRFLSTEATNVLCFKKVKLDLDRKGLTLVTGVNKDWDEGSNGSGKSSLVSLPFIPLFGRTFKDQTHDSWARQGTKDPCGTSLRVQLPDSKQLRVVRGRRPPNLRVYLDEKEVTMGDVNSTQKLIESLTNLTWEVLTNSVYIGQREIGSVFGTDKERKELFSQLLGLDRFLNAQEKIRKQLLRAKCRTAETECEIGSVSAALAEANRGVPEIEQSLKDAPVVDSGKISEMELTVSDREAAIRRRKLENDVLTAPLEENQKQFEKLLFRTSDLETQIRSFDEQLEITSKLSKRCPTCGSTVDVKHLGKYLDEIQEKKEAAAESLNKVEQSQQENRTARKAILEKSVANDLANRNAQAEIQKLSQSAATLRQQLDARIRLEEVLDQKQNRIRDLTAKSALHKSARKACLDEEEFLQMCADAVGRNGLPAYLCSVVAPSLNQAASRYSQAFTEGEINVQFEISGGDIDVKVMNLHGGENVKDQSQGEMRMAGLITAFAFRDALVPHNLLVLDEPGEGLDARNAARFARGLNSLVEKFQHVIIISHSIPMLSELEPDFHLEVVKKNGVSRIITL